MAIIYQGTFNPTTRALRSLCDLIWNALPDGDATGSLNKRMLDKSPFDYAFASAKRNPISIPSISPYEINRLSQCTNYTLILTTNEAGFEEHFEAAKGDVEKNIPSVFLRGITDNRITYTSTEKKTISISLDKYQGLNTAKALPKVKPSTPIEFTTKVYIGQENQSGEPIHYSDLIQVILHEIMAHVMPFCDFAYSWNANTGDKDLRQALMEEMDTVLFEHRCLITNGPVGGKENSIIKRYLNSVWRYYKGCSSIKDPNDPKNPNKDCDRTWKAYSSAQYADFSSIRKRCQYGPEDKNGRDWFKISMDTVDAYNFTPEDGDEESAT